MKNVTKIKVLVVDDSAFMRKMITDLLEEDNGIEVIGTAKDGKDGLEKIQRRLCINQNYFLYKWYNLELFVHMI